MKKKQQPFLHLSLGKAGAFTLESHICVKTLKCKGFQIIRVAQLLNNIIVWMVLYCEHQLLGVKKKQNPFSTFLWVKLVPLL